MGILNPDTLCQIALVVKDVEKVAAEYANLFGVPVPNLTCVPDEKIAHTQFRGTPSATKAKIAVFTLGQVVLEITQPDDEPSSWKEFLETHGEGVHHIAFMVPDREPIIQYFKGKGAPIRHYGEYPGGNYTVFDTQDLLKVLIQVKQKTKSSENS